MSEIHDDAPVTYKIFNERLKGLEADRETTKQNFERIFEQLEAFRKELEANRKEREEAKKEREEAKKKREENEANMRNQWIAGNYWAYFLTFSSIHAGTSSLHPSTLARHTKVE